MGRRRRRIGQLAILLLALVGAIALFRRFFQDSLIALVGPSVGLIEVSGVLSDAEDTIDALKRFREADGVAAIVLRIDSPGGGVAPSQEIYSEVVRTRETKSVIASLGNVAASGGYYIASACDRIVANPGTLTGSIGVIMSLRNIEELARWAGIKETVIKSGPYKDITNPLRPLTDEEKRLLQETVDDVHGQFISAVAEGRNMDEQAVRRLADGRLFSGAQALRHGMVDALGGLEEAIEMAGRAGGIEGEPRTVRAETSDRPWWMEWIGGVVDLSRFSWFDVGLPDGLLFLYVGHPIDVR